MSLLMRMMGVAATALLVLLTPVLMTAQADGESGLPIEFSGTVSALQGATLVVNDQTIDTSQIILPEGLRVGDWVGVRGLLLQDGRILARSIVILSSGLVATPVPPLPPAPTPQPGSQGVCPRAIGYWTGAAGWPVETLMLGTQSYSRNELLVLLNATATGDASVRLARQLIVAKLNIAAGSASQPIGETVLQADLLLSQFGGKLPHGILPTATVGPSMLTYAELLDSYNRSLITPFCQPAEPDVEPPADEGTPRIVVIEGPVAWVNGNIVRVYNFNVLVQPENPILARLNAGDVIRVEGTLETRADWLVLVATTLLIVDDRPAWADDVGVGRPGDDPGDRCANPPPDHAPAHGWRWQCEGAPHPGRGNGRGAGRGN